MADIIEMVISFRKGDFTLKNKFILYHVRIAIYTVRKLGRDSDAMLSEMFSEAFLQLCKIPEEVFKGRLVDFGLTPYTVCRIKTVCVNFMRSDRVFKIPAMSAWRTGKRVHRQVKPQYNNKHDLSSKDDFMFEYSCRNLALVHGLVDSSVSPNNKARALFDEILSCVKTEGERLVILYRSQEYTDKEIAYIMGTSTSDVINKRRAVEKRYNILKENEKEIEK